MDTHVLAQVPASTITTPASVTISSANAALATAPAENRRVRVGITNTTTGARRQLVVPFADLLSLIAGLSPTEQLGPAYSDEVDPDADIGGILVFEAPSVMDRDHLASASAADLWQHIRLGRHGQHRPDIPCIGISRYSPNKAPDGASSGAVFIVAVDTEDDPGVAGAIGELIEERSRVADAKNYANYCVCGENAGTRTGVHLRALDGVPGGIGAPHLCAGGSSFLEWDGDLLLTSSERFRLKELLPPLTPKEFGEIGAARETRRLANMSDYERVASMLGSAEPVFFAATRDLSGSAVWDMMTTLQRAAEHFDPLANFVRTKVVPLADRHRAHAADQARFDILLTAQLRESPTYLGLSSEDAALIKLAAWLFVAPASLFVGKGKAAAGPLIVPGHGERRKMTWLVEGWMPSVGVGAFVGGAGEGKSFIAADLAARVATVAQIGVAKFGGRTVSGAPSVLYCGCEGVEGWTERAERQIPHVSGRSASEPHGLCVANGVPLLSSPITAITWVRDRIDDIVKAGGQTPALILVDHLRGATTGNEDKSDDMDLALSTAWAIARMCGCFVLLIHHAKKNSDGGNTVARGSSAIKANLDFEATIKKVGDSYKLTVAKNRNGIEGEIFSWHIPTIDAPLHEGSGISLPDDRKISERAAEAAGRVIWENATKTRGLTTKELNDSLVTFCPSIFVKADSKRDNSRLLRARADAVHAGYAAEGKGKTWIPGDTEPPDSTPPDLSTSPASLADIAD